ncbi:MAG: hypothetical protein AAF125_07105, partial [Chloroflexota bacterium]
MSFQQEQFGSLSGGTTDQFTYHEPIEVVDMADQEINDLYDLIPLEDRDLYKRILDYEMEAAGVTDDVEEYQALLRIRKAFLKGDSFAVPVDVDRWLVIPPARAKSLKRKSVDAASADEVESMRAASASGGSNWFLLGAIVVGALIFFVVMMRLMFGGGESQDQVAVVVSGTPVATFTPEVSVTPSPIPSVTPTPTATPFALVEADRFIASGDLSDRDFFPVAFRIFPSVDESPRDFVIQERVIEQTEWDFEFNPDVLSWISGTAIRPVLGVPYSDSNRAFLSRLEPGTRMVLRMNTGYELHYLMTESLAVGRDQTGFMRQDEPGVVLGLIGEVDDLNLPTASRFVVVVTYDETLEVE